MAQIYGSTWAGADIDFWSGSSQPKGAFWRLTATQSGVFSSMSVRIGPHRADAANLYLFFRRGWDIPHFPYHNITNYTAASSNNWSGLAPTDGSAGIKSTPVGADMVVFDGEQITAGYTFTDGTHTDDRVMSHTADKIIGASRVVDEWGYAIAGSSSNTNAGIAGYKEYFSFHDYGPSVTLNGTVGIVDWEYRVVT